VADAGAVTITASVTRADDLLVVSFEFFNLQLEPASGGWPARLVRVTPGQAAFIAVILPPQHVAEQIQADGQSARRADPTRLVFRLADDMDATGFTLEDLLDWGRYVPSITANAVAEGPPDPTDATPAILPALPAPTETAIEVPYRLVLSPDATAGWSHATGTVTRDGVTELWQTRLGVRRPGGVDETQLPVIRAVWSRDIKPGDTALALADDAGLPGWPLDNAARRGIVSLSSFFGQEILILPPVREPLYYIPPALQASHLALSALGAWTDIRGDWDFPQDPGTIYPNQGPTPLTNLIAWRHVVAQGRDQDVRVVTRGFLYPLGHRADQIMVSERRLDPDGIADGLVRSEIMVVVRERARDYDAYSAVHPENHALPLRKARIETLVTPPQPQGALNLPFVVTGTDGAPLQFQVIGEDWSGRPVDLRMPLVFVPERTAGEPSQIGGASTAYGQGGTVSLGGQQMALAPSTDGSATLPVRSLVFTATAQESACLPYVARAEVSIPAIDHLVGAVAPNPASNWVVLTDPATTAGDVFARLVTPADDGSVQFSTLAVDLPAQRAGGVARPSVAVGALSRSLGAVPPGLEDLASITPKLFAGSGASTLLGAISLIDIISAVTTLDQLPKVQRQETAAGTDITFRWTPPLRTSAQPQSIGPLVLNPGAALSLSTSLHIPAGDGQPRSVVHGILTNFAINFVDVAEVSFESIEFTSEQGKQMTVRPTGVRLRLQRELEFLNALADILPANGFSDGPTLAITPRGVTAGYSLGLPGAGIGIFSLEQVALSAGVTLPFDNTPAAVRLTFSERAHPFLATVSMIGGAGFFALEVDTQGVQRIEGSIEVGANMTVDLAVVAANVHVMAGFYFGLKRVGDGNQIDFSAYLRIGGAVELLGIAGISVDIIMSMTLELSPAGQPASIGGRASVVVSVHLLMFSKSLSLSTEKHFAIAANDPTFDELISEDDWETYCRAFA